MASARRNLDRRALFASGAAAALLAASGIGAVAMPRRGGHLRIAAADGAGAMLAARMAVFDTLTEVAPDGLLKGDLATGWHGSEDARRWRIGVREDAVFGDGRPVCPEDAIATLLSAGSPVGDRIAEARAVAGGIEVDLMAPDSHFPYRLADPALVIARGGQVPARMESWVGSGLYRLTHGSDGRHFLGRRVDAHPRDGQAGWADSVEVIALSDAAVRAEALRDGFVDVAEDPADASGLMATDRVAKPAMVSSRGRLDDGRIAERWWMR
ncbi:MAG: ABC transporter substrate-binding protein [Marinibacterium sp.]